MDVEMLPKIVQQVGKENRNPGQITGQITSQLQFLLCCVLSINIHHWVNETLIY